MCGFDLKLKILTKKGNIESSVTTMKPRLLYTPQPQINLGITLRAMKRKEKWRSKIPFLSVFVLFCSAEITAFCVGKNLIFKSYFRQHEIQGQAERNNSLVN